MLTGMSERWSWRSKHTQPTESTLILLSLHYSLYFDLTFKGQGFSPSKEMQRKTTTTTPTLQLSMSAKQHNFMFLTFPLTYRLISVFICFFFENYSFCMKDLHKIQTCSPNNSNSPDPCSFCDSLQALRRRTPQENHSQCGVASSSRWTDETTVSPTPAAWSTCLCPTLT